MMMIIGRWTVVSWWAGNSTASASLDSASRRLTRHRYTSRNAASIPHACPCPSWPAPAGQDGQAESRGQRPTAKFLSTRTDGAAVATRCHDGALDHTGKTPHRGPGNSAHDDRGDEVVLLVLVVFNEIHWHACLGRFR
jgi:hypothetical protein